MDKYFGLDENSLSETENKFMDKLNEMLNDSAVGKSIFQLVLDYTMEGKDPEEEEYVDALEIDGKTYFATYEFEARGVSYSQFVNEEDPADNFFMKRVWEGEEEYFQELDSEYEKNLVLGFQQKHIFERIRKKLGAELEDLEREIKKLKEEE